MENTHSSMKKSEFVRIYLLGCVEGPKQRRNLIIIVIISEGLTLERLTLSIRLITQFIEL